MEMFKGASQDFRPYNWWIFVAISSYLAVIALWRVFVLADEMGVTPVMDLLVDTALVFCVVWLGRSLKRQLPSHGPADTIRGRLMFAGVAGGLVVLAIRLFTYDGWFSGHLRCCDLSR